MSISILDGERRVEIICGIVGIAGDIYKKEKAVFGDLLFFDSVRGEDSTGVLSIGSKETRVDKCLGGPWNMKPIQFDPITHAMLGHNRFATQGKVDIDGAHPFEFENVIGVHNGTVHHYQLKTFPGYNEFDIDSQIIYSQLNADPDPAEIWKKVDGAMALVWYDKRTRKFNFARNTQRPLHYALSKNNRTIVWASERWMISVATSRREFEIQDIIPVKPNVHYTIDKNEKGLIKIKEVDLPKYVAPFFTKEGKTTNFGKGTITDLGNFFERFNIESFVESAMPFGSHFLAKTTSGKDLVIKVPFVTYEKSIEEIKKGGSKIFYKVKKKHLVKRTNGKNIWYEITSKHMTIEPPELAIGWEGVKMNMNEYFDKTKQGCECCKQNVDWSERGDLKWVSQHYFVCEGCVSVYNDILKGVGF